MIESAQKKVKFLHLNSIDLYFADPIHSIGERNTSIPDRKDKYIFPFKKECEFYIYSSETNQSNDSGLIDELDSIIGELKNSGWTTMKTLDKNNNLSVFYGQKFKYDIVCYHLLKIIDYRRFMSKELAFVDFQLPLYLACISAIATICSIFV